MKKKKLKKKNSPLVQFLVVASIQAQVRVQAQAQAQAQIQVQVQIQAQIQVQAQAQKILNVNQWIGNTIKYVMAISSPHL